MTKLTYETLVSLDGFTRARHRRSRSRSASAGSSCTSGSFALEPSASDTVGRAARRAGRRHPSESFEANGRRDHGPADVQRRRGALGERPERRRAGGATTPPSASRCSCSPTTRANRWRGGRDDVPTSSPTGSRRRSSERGRRRATRTSASPAARGRAAVPEGRPPRRAPDPRGARPARRGRAAVRRPWPRSSRARMSTQVIQSPTVTRLRYVVVR